ncbi:PAS domain-containing protein [Geomonas sp. Red32]|uniref:PAS domain-containing protein n=1 Tax=Geomonas sp. Red32 TaxID=2912856 RepID=UPI00202CFB1C|nr:PAS domain-containing protein [Geomonas sp. Red32]
MAGQSMAQFDEGDLEASLANSSGERNTPPSAPGAEVWAATFDAIPDLAAIIGTDHVIIQANQALARHCGLPRHEVIGKRCYEIIHGSPCPPPNCPHHVSVRLGVSHRAQIEAPSLDKVFEITVSPILDADGSVSACVHLGRDITARRKGDAFRQMGQQILRVLNDTEGQRAALGAVVSLVRKLTAVDAVGIRLQDGDDFPFFHQEGFSDSFLGTEMTLLGREPGGGPCLGPDGKPSLQCTCGTVLCGAQEGADLFTPGGSFWTNDTLPFAELPVEKDPRIAPRNECIHHGFRSVALIPIRAKGRIAGLLQLNDRRTGRFSIEAIEALEDVAKNIGEALLRKQAEEKLKASQQFLSTLTDQLPGLVAYWNRDLRCTYANHAYERWFGRPRDEVMRLTLPELLGEETFRLHEAKARAALNGEYQLFERSLKKPGGESGHLWVHYIPDVVDDQVHGFYVLGTDVTELKETEEAKDRLELQLQQAQKLESVGRLAGGVAHDFNNMLGVILGHAELALMKLEHFEPPQDDLIAIRNAAERSANLTRQLLAFARKQTISPRVMNLNDTVSGMMKMLQRLIGEDIELTWQPSPDLWQVKADPSQLDQILANLCVNSRDAIADTGRITIGTQNSVIDDTYCKMYPDAIPGSYVRLSVSDDGCGMDQQTRERIFEPFYTTKEVGKGTGLGLATVFGIVKQNQGFITVFSEPGHGTVFSIYLPRFQPVETQAVVPSHATEAAGGKETVLVVEDEPTILKMTEMMLEHQGYRVVTAGTPEEAVRIASQRRDPIHLLITDVIMPAMNGKDLGSLLRTLYPELKCLFMSGYTSDVIAQHGVLEEKVNFIQKPFSLQDLASKVRQALDR